jgi:hypothetical protein
MVETAINAGDVKRESFQGKEKPPRKNANKHHAYPERFAQEALGHNSKAVHRAYAKRALMKIPSLEDYEQRTAVLNNGPKQGGLERRISGSN